MINIEELSYKIAECIAGEKDKVIRSAYETYLGRPYDVNRDMPHCSMSQDKDGKFLWYYDGIPVIKLQPMSMQEDSENFNATIDYQVTTNRLTPEQKSE